ncbi:hypothetical protein ILUMI_25753 [Ignelater luminosus]|uniref:Uncharacterized protein n=1 Tax=Ignelater luminosus TaxID=2038154 RepID=A0A8K0C540_IGNLU|nr:hypothetical protein ILUMI_25753 [Ignelater luminosus]
MESLLRVDTSSTFPGSPTNSFLADEVASTCPLLTPSPPTNALVNPLPDPEESNFLSAEELATKLHHVHDDNTDNTGGDSASASSSSSALAEPACTQLLTGHNHYLHITKDEETAAQVNYAFLCIL